jgi:transcriptional regulator
MYVPRLFERSDPDELHAFMARHSFALLCSTGPDGEPFASHLPLLFDRQPAPGVLVGHMARANPQWQHADGRPVLAVFSGPHAYVSPAWYGADEVVPTWNYAAVHATGVFRATDEPAALLEIVRRSVAAYEAGRADPWRLDPGAGYVERLLGGIVGFRVELTRLEGKWKMSQNQPADRRARVVEGLRARGGGDDRAVAELMEQAERRPG